MMSSGQQHRDFSDGTIRHFLLAQLSLAERSVFEAVLFTNSQLEHRARLVEIELIDDYAAGCLRANERAAFRQRFLVTGARQKQLEVSAALQRSLASHREPGPASKPSPFFLWPRLAWRLAFSILALAVLLASVMVIRREPQIVKKVIPKRWRPVAVVTPTPQAAHHTTSSAESPLHRDEALPLPAHEAAPQAIVLRPSVIADDAPVTTFAQNNSANVVRLELRMERPESATFSIAVATSSGEVVHHVPEMHVEASDRIDFDVQIERLKPGEYQVTVRRLTGDASVMGTFYFRVQ